MFGWEYPPHHSGGLGVACKGMAHALIDNDVHVCFVLPRKLNLNESKVMMRFADTVHTTGVKKLTEIITPPHLESLSRELQNPYLTSIEYEKRLQNFIAAGGKIVPHTLFEQVDYYGTLVKTFSKEELGQYDVIHAHDWLCFPAGIAAKEITGKPLIVHVHATEFDRCGGKNVNQVVYDREKEGMHTADHIIAVSELTKKTVVEHYGVNPQKITVIHNGNSLLPQPTTKYAYLKGFHAQGKKVVLYAGRITIQKGVDYFIRAAKKVLDHEKDVYFIVAGSGDMEQQLIELVSSLGMSNHFIFTGYYTLSDLAEFLSASDLFVMPSVSEPFGVTPLESMSNGIPVIISKQSGVSEVISHALKVDFWDTDEMANQIISVLRYSSLQNTLKHEGLRQVEGITWDKAAKKLKTLYHQVS